MTKQELEPAANADESREPEPQPADAALVEADTLVEDVSIDGMCGVY